MTISIGRAFSSCKRSGAAGSRVGCHASRQTRRELKGVVSFKKPDSMWLTLLVAICLLELNVLCKILKQSLNHLLELIKLQLFLVTVAPYMCLW